MDRAESFARLNAGSRSAARIAMMAITTSNSINVKAEHNASSQGPECPGPAADLVRLSNTGVPVLSYGAFRMRKYIPALPESSTTEGLLSSVTGVLVTVFQTVAVAESAYSST